MFKKYNDINQFRQVVKDMNKYDTGTIFFTGTVKIHGTNAAVRVNGDSVIPQSRNRDLSIESDNAGFAVFAKKNELIFKSIARTFSEDDEVVIFGEWCGGSIQKGVAVSELDKMFVIFDVMVGGKYVSSQFMYEFKDERIFGIHLFDNFEIEVDPNHPELASAELSKITEQVESECPVGKYFGVSGIGEGVVWTGHSNGYRMTFKVKGEKHSVSKVKTLAPVDIEKVNSVNEFVEKTMTENRLRQGIEYVFTQNSLEPSLSMTGDFVKWCTSDVFKEETDTLIESGLVAKDVGGALSKKASKWFRDNYC